MKPFASIFRRTLPKAGQPVAQATPVAYWGLAPEQLLSALHTSRSGLQPADMEPLRDLVAVQDTPGAKEHRPDRSAVATQRRSDRARTHLRRGDKQRN